MQVKHDETQKRMDLYDDNGAAIGEIEYMRGGNKDLYATHTQVFAPYDGKGMGEVLVDALADYARKEGYKITPICPYVIYKFKKKPEKYADVAKEKKYSQLP